MKFIALEIESPNATDADFEPHLLDIIPLIPYAGLSRLFA